MIHESYTEKVSAWLYFKDSHNPSLHICMNPKRGIQYQMVSEENPGAKRVVNGIWRIKRTSLTLLDQLAEKKSEGREDSKIPRTVSAAYDEEVSLQSSSVPWWLMQYPMVYLIQPSPRRKLRLKEPDPRKAWRESERGGSKKEQNVNTRQWKQFPSLPFPRLVLELLVHTS